jgi:probable F420-dependent oxidoreductase
MKADYYFAGVPPEGAAAAAVEARSDGYDGFFTAETQFDPFLPLMAAATAAPELELGTAITVAFPRSPMVLAYTAWDLARLTGGRFMLGLGTQIKAHITRRFSTEWGQPAARLRDYILALRAIWGSWQDSTPLSYDGDFYQFSLMTPFFNPGPIPHPLVPVYIAGVGPVLSRLAGEVCDGFHVHPLHTVAYLDQVVRPNIEKAATGAGRSAAQVEMVATVFVITGRDENEIEQAKGPVRQQIAFYGSTPSYRPVLEASGWDIGDRLHAMSRRGEWAEMAEVITDDILEEVGVQAPVDRLAQAIKDRYGDRVDRVGFYTLGSVLDTDKDALRQVIAELKR